MYAEVEYSPFYGIEKSAVLQEARMFNDRVVDARRCQQVCTLRDLTCHSCMVQAALPRASDAQ